MKIELEKIVHHKHYLLPSSPNEIVTFPDDSESFSLVRETVTHGFESRPDNSDSWSVNPRIFPTIRTLRDILGPVLSFRRFESGVEKAMEEY